MANLEAVRTRVHARAGARGRDNELAGRRNTGKGSSPTFEPRFALLSALILALATASSAHAATASVQYTYDPLGRIATALYDNGVCVAYTYDPSGNRTSQSNTTSAIPESPVWGAGVWGCFQWTGASAELSRPLNPDRHASVTRGQVAK
ncbi:MAG: hypothetical protein ACREEB_16080 [Caulobacteraceae bacterium]